MSLNGKWMVVRNSVDTDPESIFQPIPADLESLEVRDDAVVFKTASGSCTHRATVSENDLVIAKVVGRRYGWAKREGRMLFGQFGVGKEGNEPESLDCFVAFPIHRAVADEYKLTPHRQAGDPFLQPAEDTQIVEDGDTLKWTVEVEEDENTQELTFSWPSFRDEISVSTKTSAYTYCLDAQIAPSKHEDEKLVFFGRVLRIEAGKGYGAGGGEDADTFVAVSANPHPCL